MNVPDVVQALRMMTEFSAVSLSPIQFWLRPEAEQLEQRVEAQRLADLLNRPTGAMMKIHRIVIAAELAIAGK